MRTETKILTSITLIAVLGAGGALAGESEGGFRGGGFDGRHGMGISKMTCTIWPERHRSAQSEWTATADSRMPESKGCAAIDSTPTTPTATAI